MLTKDFSYLWFGLLHFEGLIQMLWNECLNTEIPGNTKQTQEQNNQTPLRPFNLQVKTFRNQNKLAQGLCI